MKSLAWLPVSVFLVLAAHGHSQTAPKQMPSVELPAPLERVLRDYEKHWKAGDAAGLAALFSEDGFVLSSDKSPIRGRAAIQEGYRQAGGDLRLRALSYSTDGSLGFIIGAFHYGTGETDQGKFTLTLKKGADDRWLIFSDMDNSSGPRR